MKITLLLSLSFLVILGTSCKKENGTTDQQQEVVETPESTMLPAMNSDEFVAIRQQTDYIDIIFNHLPMSMSVDRQQEIQTFFDFFAPRPFDYTKNCVDEGTAVFLSQGQVLGEAKIYYGEGCFGFLIMKDQKPYASMEMNNMGINYFAQITESARQMRQQLENQ